MIYYFDYIDINDISAELSHIWIKTKKELGDGTLNRRKQESHKFGEIRNMMRCNMTAIDFTNKNYDVIYGSWALNYLSNSESIDLLKRAKFSLVTWNRKKGIIILKETVRYEG